MKRTESEKAAIAAMHGRLCAITLDERVDVRTYVHLIKHGLEAGEKMKEDSSLVLRAITEPRSSDAMFGPLFFYKQGAQATVRHAVSVSHALLNVSKEVRSAIVDYLLKGEFAGSISAYSLAKIKELKQPILSKTKKAWIPAAVELSDALEDDWLLNYFGVLQATKMKFPDGISDYLTRVMRPNTDALGTAGFGILTPTEKAEDIRSRICQIASQSPTFKAALEEYYGNFGHTPLDGDLSVSGLYGEWLKTSHSAEDFWQSVWEWADSHDSPLPRYHACSLFLNNPSLVTAEAKERLTEEVVAVIAAGEEAKGKWYEPWLIRCELARYYVEYLESRLPRANSEMIATQAWWLADRVASISGSEAERIKHLREEAVEPEGFRIAQVWQYTRLATSPSALRYATLYVHNLWALSLVSHFSPEALGILLPAATKEQKQAIHDAVSQNLVNLFPIRHRADALIYAFDRGCVEAARVLAVSTDEEQKREMLTTFVDGVVKITGDTGIEGFLKRLPEGNAADQLLSVHAVQIEACMDRAPKEFIWECLVDREWAKRVFGTLSPMCAEHLFDGLKEIQLRTGGKWDQQLPHLYASLCEDFNGDGDKRKLFFAFTVTSSLAANSVSAIDRLLKGTHRFDYREDVQDWRQRMESIGPLSPHWSRARLRAILASLHV